MALLFRDLDSRIELRSTREGWIRFDRMAEAVHYLRRNSTRPGVVTTLRRVLAEHHCVQVWRLSGDQVIDEVARRLVSGSLQLLEMAEPKAPAASTIEGLLGEEEPIEVTEVPPPRVPKEPAPEPEEVLDLDAVVEAEEPPAMRTEAQVEAPPDLAAHTEVEESPVLASTAEVKKPPVPRSEAEVEEPPLMEAQAHAEAQPELGTHAEVDERSAPDVGAHTEPSKVMSTHAEVEKPPVLTTGAEVEKEPAPDSKAPPGKPEPAQPAAKPARPRTDNDKDDSKAT